MSSLLLLLVHLVIFTAANAPPKNLDGSFAGYFTLQELTTYMISIKTRMPNLSTTPTVIGTSNQKRHIMAMCLGQCSDDTKPSTLLTGLHHAREPMGMMAVVYTMEHLVTMYLSGDSSTAALLEARSVWFVPAVNPDGYESNRAMSPNGGGNQRKNSNSVESTRCKNNQYDMIGVDLNRNYEACWSGDCPTNHDIVKHSDCGSSTKPCAEDYRGSAVFSEPESRAIRDLVSAHSKSLTTALNYHSFAKQVYMPYSCVKMISQELEEDKITMERMANEWGKEAGYIVDHVWNTNGGGLGYSAAGDASDWMFYAHGIYTITPETGPPDAAIFAALGSTSMGDSFYEYGFWPPKNTIVKYANDSVVANVRLMWSAGPCYDIAVIDIAQSAKENSAKVVQLQLKIINIGVSDKTATPLTVSIIKVDANEKFQKKLGLSIKAVTPPKRNKQLDVTLEVAELQEVASDFWVVIGDGITCVMHHVGKQNQNSKKWPILHKNHVRNCELCTMLSSNTPSPATTDPSTGTSGTTTPSPNTALTPGSSSTTGGEDDNAAASSSGSSSGSETSQIPCSPVSSSGESNGINGNNISPSGGVKKIDWSMLWGFITLLILSGCCCGCLMMLCLRKYHSIKYQKLTIDKYMDDEIDDIDDIEDGGITLNEMNKYHDDDESDGE